MPVAPGVRSRPASSCRCNHRFRLKIAALVLVLAGSAVRADEPSKSLDALKKSDETWQVIHIGPSRIGYGRSGYQTLTRNGREIVRTEAEFVLVISRFGQQVKSRTLLSTEETVDGNLLSFRNETSNPPADTTITTGRVEGDQLILETTAAGNKSTRSLAWDTSRKSPGYIDRELRIKPLKAGETRAIKSFSSEFNVLTTFTLRAKEIEEVKLLEGKTRKLLKVVVDQTAAPTLRITQFLDETGEAQKSSRGLMGINIYTVAKSEALKELSGEEIDMGLSSLVKVQGLEEARSASQIVYRIRVPDEDLHKTLAQGPAQSLKVLEKGVGDLTVKVVKPPERDPGTSRLNLSQFLASNRYIQSDDALVIKRAEEAVGGEKDPWKAAQLMERWVFTNLKQKNFSTLLGTAAEVAKSLSGDCTEHSVLLAGMARSKKIPSRCVIGLLYVPQLGAFGGHMWTEVYIRGTWIPLDATLGRGGIAPDHIKFSDTSFSEEGDTAALTTFIPLVSVLGKLTIEVRSMEKK